MALFIQGLAPWTPHQNHAALGVLVDPWDMSVVPVVAVAAILTAERLFTPLPQSHIAALSQQFRVLGLQGGNMAGSDQRLCRPRPGMSFQIEVAGF
ncbi:MAG: hypothetical protein GY720_13160 [bacterium]|nr:hypothetical protein [bacterium]